MLEWYSILYCFFFKQKTAYERRISDWSSDVCSSDLAPDRDATAPRAAARGYRPADRPAAAATRRHDRGRAADRAWRRCRPPPAYRGSQPPAPVRPAPDSAGDRVRAESRRNRGRSEEHTSELQSLMRISYAVFCLNKKSIARRWRRRAPVLTPRHKSQYDTRDLSSR